MSLSTKDLYKNFYSSLSQNSPQMETTPMPINSEIDQLRNIHTIEKHTAVKKIATATHSMKEYHKRAFKNLK